jgi:ribosomal protein S18 acetylase RimI-like enzyme
MSRPDTPLTVRAARAEDIDLLVAFQADMAAETEDKGLDRERLRDGIAYLIRHPDEGFYLIAEREGKSAGSLMVTYEWSDWRNGRFWWIQSVFVDRSYRRQGVYSALHEAIRKRAMEDPQGCGIRLYVEKENTGAQATYAHLGMEETHYRLYEEEFPGS